MTWKGIAARALILIGLVLCIATGVRAQAPTIPFEAGSFMVPAAAPDGAAVRVWTYRPQGLEPGDPIVIVMHGVGRNARTYRNTWIAEARARRFLVLVPEMDKVHFAGSYGYSLGNMIDANRRPQPPDKWAWLTVERVFDAVRAATGSTRTTYLLFGHSAGAQFVHRLVMFAENPRVEKAVSANAGWYAIPDETERFPYGLKDSPVDPKTVQAHFARPLMVLLGDEDIDPEAVNLRRTPGALRQGANRFERGHKFFDTAQAEAKRAGVAFNWRIEEVAGVAHVSSGLTKAAVRWLLGDAK